MSERKINANLLTRHLKATDQLFSLAVELGGLVEVTDENQGRPCPFCGGDDRFWRSDTLQRFFCRKCKPDGYGYSIYDLIMQHKRISFKKAKELVAERSGFFDRKPLSEEAVSTPTQLEPKKIIELRTFELIERLAIFREVQAHRPEISFADYKRAGALGFSAPKGYGIAIPMFVNDNELSGYVRYNAKGGKPMNSAGSKSGIVGTDSIQNLLQKHPAKIIFLTAGVTDRLVLSGLIAGDNLGADYFAFTTGGGEGENLEKFDTLLRPVLEGRVVAVVADNDAAGELGAKKRARYLIQFAADVRIIRPPQEWNGKQIKDLRDFVAAADNASEVLPWIIEAFENAESVTSDTVVAWNLPAPSKQGKTSQNKRPILVRVSDVEEKVTLWLWENKIPLGALSLLIGLAGVGKSFWTVYMTAIITNGWDWPDGKPCKKGSVLFFYGEEGIADTYKQRFRANGADQSKIIFLNGVEEVGDNKEWTEIDVTLKMVDVIGTAIKQTAEKTGLPVKMVVIDPISNYWGDISENSNAEVRSVLKPLQRLAEKTGVAFVMIQHEGKGEKEHAQQRSLGSTGIAAICRADWGIFIDPNDKNKRIFAPVKVNCGYNHTAVSYRITPPDGTVEIIETSIENLTGDDIASALRQAKAGKRGPKTEKLGDCVNQIKDMLKDKDVLASEIKELLRLKGFGASTIQEAKKMLGVTTVQSGKERLWHFPSDSEIGNAD